MVSGNANKNLYRSAGVLCGTSSVCAPSATSVRAAASALSVCSMKKIYQNEGHRMQLPSFEDHRHGQRDPQP